MSTTVKQDESEINLNELPGAILANIREQKGYTREFVAGRLHLRVNIIELLEADDYEKLPEAVFIKGYMRAYAKLLSISPDPLLKVFNSIHKPERKYEKALWQGRRENNRGERLVRWVTGMFIVSVVVAVGMWWEKNKDVHQLISTHTTAKKETTEAQTANDIRLTDLSKMRQILSLDTPVESLERQGG